jgi:hypothetical protein
LTVREIPFVADGRTRALRGSEEHIEALKQRVAKEVRAEHAERLQSAGAVKRLWLHLRMRRAIRRIVADEIEGIAPRNGLY